MTLLPCRCVQTAKYTPYTKTIARATDTILKYGMFAADATLALWHCLQCRVVHPLYIYVHGRPAPWLERQHDNRCTNFVKSL
jgi:hypothetical protein